MVLFVLGPALPVLVNVNGGLMQAQTHSSTALFNESLVVAEGHLHFG